MSKLIIVPTPIGNLKDITLRALDALSKADIILAEDTRTTAKLLNHYQISTKMMAYHKFNEHKVLHQLIEKIQENSMVALVSDAGTPGISDPGYLIVKKCIENNIEIESLPGATALIPALINSGLPNNKFCFEGFLPQKKGRSKRLKELADETRTMVFYESPHRLIKLLKQFVEFFGQEREVSVSRELTKIHEENFRGKLPDAIQHFESKTIKGEIVVVVEGKK
ncbi:MAG: 16S rRNA (cytidine(1402)-2'-O)-methyltransferase [Chlorobi bacterium]|nr:16S rRNA (cytidine(1402)-2'-O)-methyltransferase [Chlorobiota bacterium]